MLFLYNSCANYSGISVFLNKLAQFVNSEPFAKLHDKEYINETKIEAQKAFEIYREQKKTEKLLKDKQLNDCFLKKHNMSIKEYEDIQGKRKTETESFLIQLFDI